MGNDWVSVYWNFEVEGSRGRDRAKMTWMTRVEEDMRVWGVRSEMVLDRESWRSSILGRCHEKLK